MSVSSGSQVPEPPISGGSAQPGGKVEGTFARNTSGLPAGNLKETSAGARADSVAKRALNESLSLLQGLTEKKDTPNQGILKRSFRIYGANTGAFAALHGLAQQGGAAAEALFLFTASALSAMARPGKIIVTDFFRGGPPGSVDYFTNEDGQAQLPDTAASSKPSSEEDKVASRPESVEAASPSTGLPTAGVSNAFAKAGDEQTSGGTTLAEGKKVSFQVGSDITDGADTFVNETTSDESVSNQAARPSSEETSSMMGNAFKGMGDESSSSEVESTQSTPNEELQVSSEQGTSSVEPHSSGTHRVTSDRGTQSPALRAFEKARGDYDVLKKKTERLGKKLETNAPEQSNGLPTSAALMDTNLVIFKEEVELLDAMVSLLKMAATNFAEGDMSSEDLRALSHEAESSVKSAIKRARRDVGAQVASMSPKELAESNVDRVNESVQELTQTLEKACRSFDGARKEIGGLAESMGKEDTKKAVLTDVSAALADLGTVSLESNESGEEVEVIRGRLGDQARGMRRELSPAVLQKKAAAHRESEIQAGQVKKRARSKTFTIGSRGKGAGTSKGMRSTSAKGRLETTTFKTADRHVKSMVERINERSSLVEKVTSLERKEEGAQTKLADAKASPTEGDVEGKASIRAKEKELKAISKQLVKDSASLAALNESSDKIISEAITNSGAWIAAQSQAIKGEGSLKPKEAEKLGAELKTMQEQLTSAIFDLQNDPSILRNDNAPIIAKLAGRLAQAAHLNLAVSTSGEGSTNRRNVVNAVINSEIQLRSAVATMSNLGWESKQEDFDAIKELINQLPETFDKASAEDQARISSLREQTSNELELWAATMELK